MSSDGLQGVLALEDRCPGQTRPGGKRPLCCVEVVRDCLCDCHPWNDPK